MEDVRGLKAVNGDCLRSALDLDGVGHVAPVDDTVWDVIQGLEGYQEGTLP